MSDKKKPTPSSASTGVKPIPGNSPRPPQSSKSKTSTYSANRGGHKSWTPSSTTTTRPGPSQASTSSNAQTNPTLDLINQRLLALRLKKEEELQRRKAGYAYAKRKVTEVKTKSKEGGTAGGTDANSTKSKSNYSLGVEKKNLPNQNLPTLPLSASSAKQFALPFKDSPKKSDNALITKPLKLYKSPPPVPTPAVNSLKGSPPPKADSGQTSKTPNTAPSAKPPESNATPIIGIDKGGEPQPRTSLQRKSGPQTLQQDVGTQSTSMSTQTPVENFPEPEKVGVESISEKDNATNSEGPNADAKRGSIGSHQAVIEVTESIPNLSPLLDSIEPDTQNDVWYYYSHPIAIERSPHNQITNRHDRKSANESVLDLLRTVKDEQPQITIIPADESTVVELEVEQWKKHRRTFLILFWIAFFMGILIIGLTLASSIIFYFYKRSVKVKESGVGFLMHSIPMIIANTFISGMGIIIFRMFPNIAKHILVRTHILIFTIVYLLMAWAYAVAYLWHEEVTGQTAHLYSCHAQVGTLLIGFLMWEAVTGIYIIYRPASCLVKYHGSVGMISFMLFGGCSVSGYAGRALLFTGPLHTGSPLKTALSNTTGVLIIVFCCLVRYISTEFRFRRRSCPQWDTVFARNSYPGEDANIDVPSQTLQKFVRMNLREGKKQG